MVLLSIRYMQYSLHNASFMEDKGINSYCEEIENLEDMKRQNHFLDFSLGL